MSHEPGSTSNPTQVYIIYICIYIYISVYIIIMNNNKLNKNIYIYAEICRMYPASMSAMKMKRLVQRLLVAGPPFRESLSTSGSSPAHL